MSSGNWRPFCFGLNVLINKMAADVCGGNMSNFVVITMSADALAPWGARASAAIGVIRVRFCISTCGTYNCRMWTGQTNTSMTMSSNGNFFPCYWPFVRGIHRSPVNSPHKGQWCGALMFTLICARINGSVNNRDAGDLRCHHAHCDVIVMIAANHYNFGQTITIFSCCIWFYDLRSYYYCIQTIFVCMHIFYLAMKCFVGMWVPVCDCWKFCFGTQIVSLVYGCVCVCTYIYRFRDIRIWVEDQ